MATPVPARWVCCRHCLEWDGPCPDGGHVAPCQLGCDEGTHTVRPLIWTTSGWRMVAE